MFGFLNKVTDPVCKMKVDKKTEHFSDYQNSKNYFCSENCKNQFDAKPEDFIKENAMGSCCKQNTKSCC